MSLQIEQKISNNSFTAKDHQIYSTGVRLIPMKIRKNGNDAFIWVADEFLDDTYFEGNIISPKVIANEKDDLLGL